MKLLFSDAQAPAPLQRGAPPNQHFNKLYDPLWLYSQAVVTPGSGGAGNTAAMMNPHGLPMELLEVRWQIYPNNTASDQFREITGLGVGVKMDMGDIPLVDSDVPLSGFGTSRDDAESSNNSSTVIYPNPNDTSITTNPYAYRWRLKHPLYVPPGCVVSSGYTHLGQNHFPVTIDAVYVCRSLPVDYMPPQMLRAPWVGSYNSIAFDNLASQPAGRDASSELDLINPFRQPLELSRMCGRCVGVLTGGGAGLGGQFNLEMADQFRYSLGKVRIRSRAGDELARNPTPFNGMFPYGWRVWDIPGGWTMRPGEFYKVQLSVGATTTAPSAQRTGSIQYAISTIGYRQLPLKIFLAAAEGGNA